MSERLTVIHGVSVAVEEVASRLNYFVTDDGVEVTHFNRQVAVASFQVQLWQCRAILATVVSSHPGSRKYRFGVTE